MTYTLPDTYGYVLIVATILAFEIIIIGFGVAGRVRVAIFSKEWMQANFNKEHQEAFGEDIDYGGYPDQGSGYYARKLTYKQWMEFMNAQRPHANFLEFAPSLFIFLLIAGLYFPIPAAAIGLACAILRVVYTCGYMSAGPNGRLIGATGFYICLLGLIGLSFASGIMMCQGKQAVA